MFLCLLSFGILFGAQGSPQTAVENDRVTLAVDSHGAVASMVDKKSGRDLIAAPGATPLFRLEFSQADDARAALKSCHAGQAEQVRTEPWSRGADRGIKIVFSGFGGRPIEIVSTIFTRAGDQLLRFGLEVRLPPNLTLESVTYPVVSIGSSLANGAHCVAVVGAGEGGVRPLAEWKIGQSRRFDQPGTLAAAFGCCYDEAGGLYTAAYDGQTHRKSLSLKRTSQGLEIGWRHPCFHRAHFKLPYDLVLGGFSSAQKDRPADWRDAADLYKAWAVRQSWCARLFTQRKDVPGWLTEGPAMVRFTRAWLAEPAWIESWLGDYWKKELSRPAPLIVAYWGWEKVGKWVGPDYFPAYPSDERFRALVGLGRSLGAHTFLWPSGYNSSLSYGKRSDGSFAWDIRDRLDGLRPHLVVTRNGEGLVRDCLWLRGGQQAVLCPGDPWTIAWLNEVAVGCAQRGAEIVQIDQAVGGNTPVCYSRAHDHAPGPGGWSTDAFRKQLHTMLKQCRAIEPDSVVGFEQPNEWFLQDIGIQDYRDCDFLWNGGEPASVFSYLYHEYLPTLFQSNRPQTGYDPWALAWCLVQGQIPHLAPRMGIGPGPMVVDGGFEKFSDDGPVEFARTLWYPGDRWAGGDAETDLAVHRSGRASLRLSNLAAGGRALAAQNYEVTESFRPGRTYRLSVWMRSTRIDRPNGVLLKAFAPGMSLLETWQLSYPSEQSQWTRGQLEFCMPTGTTLLRVMLALDGPGSVWLDDLKIEELMADGRLAEVQRPERPVDHELMRQWLALWRGAGRPYLFLGKMLHAPHLTTAPSIPAGTRSLRPVLHNAFQAPDGSQAVVLVNWTTAPQTVGLTWKGRIQTLVLPAGAVRLVN